MIFSDVNQEVSDGSGKQQQFCENCVLNTECILYKYTQNYTVIRNDLRVIFTVLRNSEVAVCRSIK